MCRNGKSEIARLNYKITNSFRPYMCIADNMDNSKIMLIEGLFIMMATFE
jgi:hypothetical protein